MYYTTKLSPSVLLPVSVRQTTMRGHTPTTLLTTSTSDGIDNSPVMMAWRRLERDIIQSRCSAPSNARQKIPLSRTDPKIQRRKRTPFAGIVSVDADQILGTLLASGCTHFPDIRRKCRPTHATHQKLRRGTLNYPQQLRPTRALTTCMWHHWRSGP